MFSVGLKYIAFSPLDEQASVVGRAPVLDAPRGGGGGGRGRPRRQDHGHLHQEPQPQVRVNNMDPLSSSYLANLLDIHLGKF